MPNIAKTPIERNFFMRNLYKVNDVLFQNIALDCASVSLNIPPHIPLVHFHLPLSTRSWWAARFRLFVLFPDHTYRIKMKLYTFVKSRIGQVKGNNIASLSRLSLKSDSSTSSEEKSLGTTSWTLAASILISIIGIKHQNFRRRAALLRRSTRSNKVWHFRLLRSSQLRLEIVPLASAWSGSKPLPRIGTKGICLNYNII